MSALERFIINKPIGEYTALDNAVYHLWRMGQTDEIMFTVAETAAEELEKLHQCQSIIATINGNPVRCEHPATREAITGRSFVRVCDRCFECFYCTEKSLEK